MILGIDLGTTNSLVGIWQDNQGILIPNALGQVLTPSAVSMEDDGLILVGQAAKERLVTHPERTVASFKRYMGSRKRFRLGQQYFTPEELSALVLRSLKADAEVWLRRPVTEAVITVPAYFNDLQRKATLNAAAMAGLTVPRLLNEPTAAAMAYGLHNRDREKRILVLDLGGGTFDVTLLELFEGVMEVRASTGDNFLGGDDFTRILADGFSQHLTANLGLACGFEHRNAAVIQLASEYVKRQFGHDGTEGTPVRMRVLVDKAVREWEISEQRFEELCTPLLERIRQPIERAMRDARLRVSQLDDIVLAGGATRMPVFRRLITRLFGRFPSLHLDPDTAIAHGAVIQAGLQAREEALNEVILTDVAPYSLGVETACRLEDGHYSPGNFCPIIERNTVIPASRVKWFQPLFDRQTEVILEIYQGESRRVGDNILLGRLAVPVRPGRNLQNIQVRFSHDVSGLLEVEAINEDSGLSQRLLIHNSASNLTVEEVAASVQALAALKVHPRDQLENRTLLARGERLFTQLLGNRREMMQLELATFEAELDSQDTARIRHVASRFGRFLDQMDEALREWM